MMQTFKFWCMCVWACWWPPALLRMANAVAAREHLIRTQREALIAADGMADTIDRFHESAQARIASFEQELASVKASVLNKQPVVEASLVFYSALHDAGMDPDGPEFATVSQAFNDVCSDYLLAEAKVIGVRAAKQLLDHNAVEQCGCDESHMLRDQLREHQALYDACAKWFHELAPSSPATLREPEAASFNAELAIVVCEVIGWADG
jgi:hypothetical protein